MKALLLVDIQNDFLPGGSLAVSKGDQIFPVINDLLNLAFDVIVATKDWHPVNHSSFAATHNKEVGESVFLQGLPQILWPIHCVQNTRGAEFHLGWDFNKIHQIVYKGTDPSIDSYSTFFDNGHHRSTELNLYLKERNVTTLYVAGLATDYCVKYSVLDAIKLGFKTYVVVDGCQGVELNSGDSKQALEEMEAAGAILVSSHEIII